MSLRAKVHITVHLLTGWALVLAGWALGTRPEWVVYFEGASGPIIKCGVLAALLAAFYRWGTFSRYSIRGCVAVLATLAFLFTVEIACRLSGVDFSRQDAILRRIPPYFRKPMTPTGEAYLRRSGPAEWTGRVIRTYVEQLDMDAAPYLNEAAITVRYDEHGFRNEEGLHDWDVAVAGDSFTELGHLAFTNLFTTLVERECHLRVLNLGVSFTGPLSQLSYLEDFGVAASTKDVMIVFFEGNDLEDIIREHAGLLRTRATGQRPRLLKQTSFLSAVGDGIRVPKRRSVPVDRWIHAWFRSEQGEIPVTLVAGPPNAEKVSAETTRALAFFFQSYQEFAAHHHLRAWLAYMPCKERACYRRLRIAETASAQIKAWVPSDLPGMIGSLCASHRVRFIDLTGALAEETDRSGELLYNGLYDPHLNAKGAACVARELARNLRQVIGTPPP